MTRDELKPISPKTRRSDPTPLPGSLHAEYGRCHKSGCRCAQGALHGPYWRRFWREDGRTHSVYVPLAEVANVADRCQHHRELRPSGRAVRRQLVELAQRSEDALTTLLAGKGQGRAGGEAP